MIERLIISASILVVATLFLMIGYWMGRKTHNPSLPGEPLFGYPKAKHTRKKQGEPLIEFDQFQQAMMNPKYKSTVEGR